MRTGCLLAIALCGCGGAAPQIPAATAKPAKTPRENLKPIAAAAQGGHGTFSGTIIFEGVAPKVGRPLGFISDNPRTDKYCTAHKDDVDDLSLIVDPKTKGIQDVFVYLLKRPKHLVPEPVPKEPVKLKIKNCTYRPHAAIVRVGQKILIENCDETSHNSHTNPLNPATEAYGKILNPDGATPIVYGGAEKIPVKVVCDIHNWMISYHLPLDHNFAALTDNKGQFKIGGLPPGDYKFRIWHARAGYLEKEIAVTIKAGKTVERQLSYKPSKFAR